MTFGARVVSDYNFRGISQTDRKPGARGYAEVAFSQGVTDSSLGMGMTERHDLDG